MVCSGLHRSVFGVWGRQPWLRAVTDQDKIFGDIYGKQPAFGLIIVSPCSLLLGLLIMLQLLGCHISHSLGGEFQ